MQGDAGEEEEPLRPARKWKVQGEAVEEEEPVRPASLGTTLQLAAPRPLATELLCCSLSALNY